MVSFFLRRILTVVPTFFGVTLLSFVLIHLIPGDPVEIIMGERMLDSETHLAALQRLGLDLPLTSQYFAYIKRLFHGDLGHSFVSNLSILEEFLSRFTATVELTLGALFFAIVIGLPIGIFAALWRGRWIDHSVMGFALTGYSMPIYWWGIILIMFFSVHLGWVPVSGRVSLVYDIEPVSGFMLIDAWLCAEQGAWLSAVRHLILPCVVLGTIPLAVIARMTRSSMLEVLREDYIRTARAKGISSFRVIFIHALRNAMIPIVTVIGLQMGSLLSGAVLTETIFSWPGVGKWLIDAVILRDYPVVQNGILLIATIVILVNLSVDLLHGIIDPRVR